MQILSEHNWAFPLEAGSVVDGISRKEVWRITE
jgi:hypothetical protein